MRDAPLIGRDDDLATLHAALARARAGEPATIVLGGEAGIGKTRLVDAFTAAADAASLRGACADVGDATLPYGPVVDALRAVTPEDFGVLPDPLRRALATLIPEAAPGDAEPFDGGQAGVFGAVQRLLEHLGAQQPVVLVLEDLHWADGSTQALVRYLATGLRGAQVLLVVTYRTDELRRDHPVRRLVADLGRAPRAAQRVLRPLTAAETARQLDALSAAPLDDATRAAIHARSEGNPFYSEELLAAGAIPATLRDALLARLDRLPPPAQRVASLAAACGRHVEHDVLEGIARPEGGDDEHALDDALRACVAAHVLQVDHDHRGYRFRHALLAEVAAGELLPGERRRLHERVAQLLEDRPPAVGLERAQRLAEIAHHRLLAHDRAAGLAASVAAARAAEDVHAIPEALRHYEAAIELWDAVEDPDLVVQADLPFLLERAAECSWLGFGNAKLSARLRRAAIAGLDPVTAGPRRAASLARLAVTSANIGVSAALPLFDEALSLLGSDDGDRAVAAEVRARHANVLMLLGHYDEASAQAARAIALADQAGARRDAADARVTLAVCRQAGGDRAGSVALFEEVRPFVARTGDPRIVVRFFTNYTHVLIAFGAYEGSAAVAVEGIAALEQAGLGYEGQVPVIANGAAALLALGRVADARTLMGEPPATVRDETLCLHGRLAQAALMEGALDDAAARLQAVCALPGLEAYMLVPILATAADVALWAGDTDRALALVADGERAIVERARLEAAPLLTVAVRAHAAAGDDAEAARLLQRLERIARDGGAPLPEVDQLVRVARAEQARLDVGAWRAAVAGWDTLQRPYDAACARLRLAEALAATRADRDALAETIRSAHATARDLHASHLTAALARVARRARVSLPGTVTEQPDDLTVLTAREHEVLVLVADGRTNRQIAATLFISEKTASVHVSNIMRKLGAANRGRAAAIARRAADAAATV